MFDVPLLNHITAKGIDFQDFLEVFFVFFFFLDCDFFFTSFQGKTLSIALPFPDIPIGKVYPAIEPPATELNSSTLSLSSSVSIFFF